MAARRPSSRAKPLVLALSGALAAFGVVGSAPAPAAAESPTFAGCDKIVVDSGSAGAKFPKGGAATTSFTDGVTITGCDMQIQADMASTTSIDFDDSTWTLDGNVRIRADQQQSKLSSDTAVVLFRNSEIQRITITGNPAEFEQKRPDSGLITRGHAKQIVYEAGAGTVRLVDDAWLSEGGKEITTPQLTYDIRRAEIRNTGGGGSSKSTGGNGDRVIITIDPKASKGAKKNDDAAPAGSATPSGDNDASSGTSSPPAKP